LGWTPGPLAPRSSRTGCSSGNRAARSPSSRSESGGDRTVFELPREGSSGTPPLSANKPARELAGQQGQKPPSHGTWQGAPEDGRLGGTLERRRKGPGRSTSPTDAGLTASTSFLLALDDGAYDVPGEGGLRHEPLFTAPTASGETSTTVSKACSAAPRATLVTSRRPGPRPPRPRIRRPGQPAPPRRRPPVALKAPRMASLTTPRAVPVISPASFSVLSMMSVTAVRLAFTTSPASGRSRPRPWPFPGRRSTWPSPPANEEPATVVTIASNPPIGLIGLRVG
jgi:hypothetical protein